MGVQSPSTLPSDATDPRKAHQTSIFCSKGFRITLAFYPNQFVDTLYLKIRSRFIKM